MLGLKNDMFVDGWPIHGRRKHEGEVVMTRNVEISDAQNSLVDLVELVGTGAEIVLTQNARPVARIVPPFNSIPSARVPGLHRGAIETSDDFDQPLPDNFWTSSD